MNILLVEDEAVIRQGITQLIEQMPDDFRIVKSAANAKEALHYMLHEEPPDCIITDIRMPEMDGLTLTARIREMHADIPIIIVSGYSDFEYAQQAIRYRVCDYLLKPIDRMALITAIGKIRRIPGPMTPSPFEPKPAEKNPVEGTGTHTEKTSSIIRKVREYIGTHIQDDLRLQVIADNVHLNPNYLCQLFKTETKTNLSDYITEARIERSKQLLSGTQLKIYDVARLSGYQSPKHFMLVFKQKVGKTPSAFRDEN
ncbi:response regulator transcription factor [Paenibacillus sp. Root444D2]|uniref:response regulator transcription factor n=1 Tax=Paenibacillus sp. Root444D2 TaxID=1736538 RepID=UPI00070B75EC|nr:response regulator [Paenibacillus sp. Root444D2]KQX45729.1 AraC family transcriptional regulator [Paenibacillus sp. Root444D2]